MTNPLLGRLTRIEDLRDVWKREDTDFTPWLAEEANISVLGDTIRMDLEVEATEKNVGRLRADIVARNTLDGSRVLIENQLEVTDHNHLGQLMTYSAGEEAVSIIWIAKRFTDEHRAALDWLNRMTAEGLNFFGLEMELWRIGASAIAPKFNIVSQPNEWVKTVRLAGSGEMTNIQRLHFDFWAQFQDFMSAQNSKVRVGKPNKDHWKVFPIGRTRFGLNATNGMRDGYSTASMCFYESDAKAHYFLIRDRHEEEINEIFGDVVWDELPDRIESRITVRRDISPADPKVWPELNEWYRGSLEKLDDYFRPKVKTLDASEYEWPPEPAEDID